MIETEPVERCIKLTIEYDGTDFSGWQYQPGVRTVQGELTTALMSMFREKITVYGAGRTDAGVHALGQVAHIRTRNSRISLRQIRLGINSILPLDVKLREVKEVQGDFHARFSASSRYYQYRLIRYKSALLHRFAWYPGYSWDDKKVEEAVSMLKGNHSCKSFCKARPGEERYLCRIDETWWVEDSEGAIFHIVADRFMHKMVRGIVGALVDVGRNFLSLSSFRRLLLSPTGNGATRVAPPQGLTLVRVNYPCDGTSKG